MTVGSPPPRRDGGPRDTSGGIVITREPSMNARHLVKQIRKTWYQVLQRIEVRQHYRSDFIVKQQLQSTAVACPLHSPTARTRVEMGTTGVLTLSARPIVASCPVRHLSM